MMVEITSSCRSLSCILKRASHWLVNSDISAILLYEIELTSCDLGLKSSKHICPWGIMGTYR